MYDLPEPFTFEGVDITDLFVKHAFNNDTQDRNQKFTDDFKGRVAKFTEKELSYLCGILSGMNFTLRYTGLFYW